jgi:hypothetical protein
MKTAIFGAIFVIAILFGGCADKGNSDNPIDILQYFILLCEDGKIEKAQSLLAAKNNVDYFRKFKDMNNGKDLIFIDYDYKGNDDTLRLDFELLKDMSNDTVAVVKMTSTYLKRQDNKFEKNIVLYKIDGKWKIHDYLLMPVKVN